jgi:hypothetical protein
VRTFHWSVFTHNSSAQPSHSGYTRPTAVNSLSNPDDILQRKKLSALYDKESNLEPGIADDYNNAENAEMRANWTRPLGPLTPPKQAAVHGGLQQDWSQGWEAAYLTRRQQRLQKQREEQLRQSQQQGVSRTSYSRPFTAPHQDDIHHTPNGSAQPQSQRQRPQQQERPQSRPMIGDYEGHQIQQPISWFNPLDTWFSPDNTRLSLEGEMRDEKAVAEATEKEKENEHSDSSRGPAADSDGAEGAEEEDEVDEEAEIDVGQLDGPTPRMTSPAEDDEDPQGYRSQYQEQVATTDTYVGWARTFDPQAVRNSRQQSYSSHWPGTR